MQFLKVEPQIELVEEAIRIVDSKVGQNHWLLYKSRLQKLYLSNQNLKRLHSVFISFSIISQGFWGWNPKYRGGNVKGVG
jgi:hypothetical protein